MDKLKVQLVEWFLEFTRFSRIEDFIQIIKDTDEVFIIKLYTKENSYQINIHHHKDRDYLGAGLSARKPIAGEDWTRGRDCSDGKFCKETFDSIIRDIVSAELVKVIKPSEFCNRTDFIEGDKGDRKYKNDRHLKIKIGERTFIADKDLILK